MTMSDTGGTTTSHDDNGHGGHHAVLPTVPDWTADGVSREVLGLFQRHSTGLRTATLVTGVLLVIGLIGIALKFIQGVPSQGFGFYAATVGFIIITACGAPMPVIAARLAKGDWRRTITRAGELWGVMPTYLLLLMLPLLFVLPANGPTQKTMWFGWPGAPYVYDFIGMLILALAGLVQLFMSARPDWALMRDAGLRNGPVNQFSRPGGALYWLGSLKQWRVTRATMTLASGLYMWSYIVLGIFIGTDFIMSLVPGWQDAIFPAYITISGFQSGIATLIVTLYIMKRWTPYRRFFEYDTNPQRNEAFWGLSKLLLATSLLWIYHWVSSGMLFWYGRLPREIAIIQLMMTGPALYLMIAAILLCWAIPMFMLMSNKLRQSASGVTIVATIILIGNFINQIRLFTLPWALPDHNGVENMLPLDRIPSAVWPRWEDFLIMPGLIGGMIFVYLIALRFVPLMSIWELRENLPLRLRRPYLRGFVTIVGKPE